MRMGFNTMVTLRAKGRLRNTELAQSNLVTMTCKYAQGRSLGFSREEIQLIVE